MIFVNGLSRECLIETSAVEMFKSHENHPLSEQLMQLEQGSMQEWGDCIGTPCFEL